MEGRQTRIGTHCPELVANPVEESQGRRRTLNLGDELDRPLRVVRLAALARQPPRVGAKLDAAGGVAGEPPELRSGRIEVFTQPLGGKQMVKHSVVQDHDARMTL